MMRRKRATADYDPSHRHYKSGAAGDLDAARRAIRRFDRASPETQRAFAIYLLLRSRRRTG